jgi:hypothetical protein
MQRGQLLPCFKHGYRDAIAPALPAASLLLLNGHDTYDSHIYEVLIRSLDYSASASSGFPGIYIEISRATPSVM